MDLRRRRSSICFRASKPPERTAAAACRGGLQRWSRSAWKHAGKMAERIGAAMQRGGRLCLNSRRHCDLIVWLTGAK